jgi:hypothetical protein
MFELSIIDAEKRLHLHQSPEEVDRRRNGSKKCEKSKSAASRVSKVGDSSSTGIKGQS